MIKKTVFLNLAFIGLAQAQSAIGPMNQTLNNINECKYSTGVVVSEAAECWDSKINLPNSSNKLTVTFDNNIDITLYFGTCETYKDSAGGIVGIGPIYNCKNNSNNCISRLERLNYELAQIKKCVIDMDNNELKAKIWNQVVCAENLAKTFNNICIPRA